MVIPLYKPLGISTHSFVKAYADAHGVIATHTGSLDPMADGVVVVLTGEDRFRKQEFAEDPKEYVFQLLGGLETDTHDLLGLVTTASDLFWETDIIRTAVAQSLPRFIGEYSQELPLFSAKRIDGESYFDKAKAGEEFEPESETVKLYETTLIESTRISSDPFKLALYEKIEKVEGDFRQEEILRRWDEVLHGYPQDFSFPLLTVRVVVSRRFYIRGFVRDLGKLLELPLVTFSITRTRNGNFALENM